MPAGRVAVLLDGKGIAVKRENLVDVTNKPINQVARAVDLPEEPQFLHKGAMLGELPSLPAKVTRPGGASAIIGRRVVGRTKEDSPDL